MNAEVMRIRKSKKMDDRLRVSKELDLEAKKDLILKLNENINDIYTSREEGINYYAQKVTECIYELLSFFAENDIFPDYFYQLLVKKNTVDKEYGLDCNKNIKAFYKKIEEGLGKLNGRNVIGGLSSINDNYIEMISFYQHFDMPFNDKSLVEKKSYFNNFVSKVMNNIYAFLNTDDIYEDIECMVNLLFQYMSFLVEIGINPKEYLDEIIAKSNNKKTR